MIEQLDKNAEATQECIFSLFATIIDSAVVPQLWVVSGGRVTSGDTELLKSGARLRYRHDLKCAFDVSPWQVRLEGGLCYAVDSVTGLKFWHRHYITSIYIYNVAYNFFLVKAPILNTISLSLQIFVNRCPNSQVETTWFNAHLAKIHILSIFCIHNGIDVNIEEL